MKSYGSLSDHVDGALVRGGAEKARAALLGQYECWLVRDGVEIWREKFDNVITQLGAGYILDNSIEGSNFTTVGPMISLISGASYTTGPAVGDTMASHGGWVEAGTTNAPQWDTPAAGARIDCNQAFDAATNADPCVKALTAVKNFKFSTTGTIKGCFMVIGTGAVTTNLNTSGILLSAGTFGADKSVNDNDELNVMWSVSLDLTP